MTVLLGYHRGLVVMLARGVAMIAAYIGARALAVLSGDLLGQQLLLPFLQNSSQKNFLGELVETTITDAAEGIAYSVVFFLAFVVLEFLLLHLVNGLKIIDSVPVVGKLNKLGGAVVGFFLVFLILLLVGNIFFTYIPKEAQREMGFTKKAVKETVLLNVFVP